MRKQYKRLKIAALLGLVIVAGFLLFAASLTAHASDTGSQLDRSIVTGSLAPRDYWLFESGPVRPLALSHDGERLYVANIPDGSLDMEPKATRRSRVGKSSEASGTRGIVRILLCRRVQAME